MVIADRDVLKLVAEVTGETKFFAGLAVRVLLLEGRAADIEVVNAGRNYVLVARELRWESLLAEHEFRVTWATLEERARFLLLWLLCEQLIVGAARSIAKADAALRTARGRTGYSST